MAYCEQDGTYRHVPGASGESANWYARTSATQARLGVLWIQDSMTLIQFAGCFVTCHYH